MLPLILRFFLLVALAVPAVADPSPAFLTGDRWAVFGDSISQTGAYHREIELFHLTRQSSQPLNVINSGVSGDTAVGSLRRIGWDCLAANPTVVSVMLGMNDVKPSLYTGSGPSQAKRAELAAAYETSLRQIIQQLLASGKRVILIQPSIFDDTAVLPKTNYPGAGAALASYAAIVRALATEFGVATVDFSGPMTLINSQQQALNPSFTIVGPDRIHPGAPGHLVMAYLFLQAQGAPGLVSSITIDAATGSAGVLQNATLSNLVASPGSVSFSATEAALPFPVETAAATALSLVPFTATLNRQLLRVPGLAPGVYRLAIDGQPVRDFPAEALAAGVNLAEEKNTPQFLQALAVRAALDRKREVVAKMRTIAYCEYYAWPDAPRPFDPAEMATKVAARQALIGPTNAWINDQHNIYFQTKPNEAALPGQAAAEVAAARTLATPVPHRFTLTAVPAVPSVTIINPTSPAVSLADLLTTLRLEASVTAPSGTPVVAWSLVNGPGTVTFSAPTAAQTNATFSAVGTYTLQCAATNEGGTSADRVHVGVAAPIVIQLRQQGGGYQHTATVIRSDKPTWNAGSRDQLLVGRSTAPFRSLFSFDLSPLVPGSVINQAALDLKTITGGTGTVGTVQLRQLSATPVEGTGISDGTTGSDLGTGTGTTWETRTGGNLPADLWSSGGGDFAASVLSDTPGFNATVSGQTVTLPATTALTAAVQTAHAAVQPLNLILSATNESLTTSAFGRFASDDDLLETNRPLLRLTVTGNPVPTVNPGPSPTPSAGSSATLGGAVTGSTFSQWRVLSGPGDASFSDSALAACNVTFDQAGAYILELAATGSFGETFRTLAITVTAPDPATLAGWQAQTWPGVNYPNIIGPAMDPDHDGLSNLLEWALHLDATIPDTFRPTLANEAQELQYTYTRRKKAPGASVLQVEWSETLGNDWSSVGVIEDSPVSLSASKESVTVRIPEGSAGKRFLHLKVSIP